MTKPRRYLLLSLLIVAALGLAWASLRSSPPVVPEAIKHGYNKALEQARNGMPGAARVLYQQLARPDLTDTRRIRLLAELPNYPSPQALKLADNDLQHPSPEVREAAIQAVLGLVPSGQRSLLLGPLLSDSEQSVRFAAVNALLGLSPDDQGLYFGPLQQVIDEYTQVLKDQGRRRRGAVPTGAPLPAQRQPDQGPANPGAGPGPATGQPAGRGAANRSAR